MSKRVYIHVHLAGTDLRAFGKFPSPLNYLITLLRLNFVCERRDLGGSGLS